MKLPILIFVAVASMVVARGKKIPGFRGLCRDTAYTVKAVVVEKRVKEIFTSEWWRTPLQVGMKKALVPVTSHNFYVTFRAMDGSFSEEADVRVLELKVTPEEYQQLKEKSVGLLTFEGRKFKGFEKNEQ